MQVWTEKAAPVSEFATSATSRKRRWPEGCECLAPRADDGLRVAEPKCPQHSASRFRCSGLPDYTALVCVRLLVRPPHSEGCGSARVVSR
jgi:hypothetical protein